MKPQKQRLTFIDEARALAIMSMIIAHFGPGVFQRLPALEFMAEPVLFLGRFATTTFIVVFGITLGFVYFDRFQSGDSKKISSALLRRARLLALCSLIICIPNYINLALAGDWNAYHWMFNTYSILNYYTLALLSVPLWLRWLGPDPTRRCVMLGVGHWIAGSAILQFWHLDPSLGFIEYLRMHVASGPYGYLQMSGTAILAIPVGRAIRSAMAQPGAVQTYLWQLIPVGISLVVIGWVAGMAVGEFSITAIVEGTVKTPPRAWYFLFFGGSAFVLVAALGIIGHHCSRIWHVMYPLSLFGQASLAIYTGHKYVLPSLGWLDEAGIVLEGIVRIVFPFAMFAIFCVAMMIRQHRMAQSKSKRKTSPSRPVQSAVATPS